MFLNRSLLLASALCVVVPFESFALSVKEATNLATESLLAENASLPEGARPNSQKSVVRMASDHPFLVALTQAYQTNPNLESSLRAQYASAESLPTALAGFRPNLGFEMGTSRGFIDNQKTKSKTFSTSHSGKLTLSQSLFAGWGTVASVKAAEAEILAGYAAFTKAEQDVLLAAVNAYLNLWLQRFSLDLNKKNVSVKKKTSDQARARLQVGELTLTDMAQAESELASARAQEILTRSKALQAEETYRSVTGQEPPQSLPLPQEVSQFFDIPLEKTSFLQYARDNNPEIIQGRFTKRVAEHSITVSKSTLMPRLDLSGSLERGLISDESARTAESAKTASARSNSGSVGLTLTVPLYQGGKNWSSFRKARQTATKAKLDVKAKERQVQERAVEAWESWSSAKEQIGHLTIQVDAAKLSLEGTRQESLVGERTLLDVLVAENKLLEAETQLAQAQATYLAQSYTLLNSLGHLTAAALELPVEPYPLKAYVDMLRTTWIGTVADLVQQTPYNPEHEKD